MKQIMTNYTQEDFLVWKTLFNRQIENLKSKACAEYLIALDQLSDVLNANEIPSFQKLKNWFDDYTGWSIECVPGLIPVDDFFRLLSEKKFPSSTWLRRMDQLDYLEEPDMFHDIFGHVPLLANDVFSKFMQAFGQLGLENINDPVRLVQLQRLYWFTIEFGLINTEKIEIYGAGIISSFGESNSAIDGNSKKNPFMLEEVIATEFHTDQIQTHYVVIDSFETLFESVEQLKLIWKNEKEYALEKRK